MESKYSTNKTNELYDAVRQAALYNVTDSILSISFELAGENRFCIRIYILKALHLNEKKYLEQFCQNLKENLKGNVELIFEVIESEPDTNVLDLQILNWNFYLPNK